MGLFEYFDERNQRRIDAANARYVQSSAYLDRPRSLDTDQGRDTNEDDGIAKYLGTEVAGCALFGCLPELGLIGLAVAAIGWVLKRLAGRGQSR